MTLIIRLGAQRQIKPIVILEWSLLRKVHLRAMKSYTSALNLLKEAEDNTSVLFLFMGKVGRYEKEPNPKIWTVNNQAAEWQRTSKENNSDI